MPESRSEVWSWPTSTACEGCGAEVDTTGWVMGPGVWMKCPDCRHHDIFVAPIERRRERVARAIADAADDGVFDRNESTQSDDEDRGYWRRLADAAIAAHDENNHYQEETDRG